MKTVKVGSLVYSIWKDRKGYAVGTTQVGDLFIGYYEMGQCEYYKATEENREFVLSQWELNKTFA